MPNSVPQRPARAPTNSPKRPEAKPPAKLLTRARLMNIAVHHLERFSSSRENLRRVLERRLRKNAQANPDAEQVRADIAAVLADLERQGVLDDARYAEGAVRALVRQGQSQRAIRARMAAKGVDRDAVDAALTRLAEDSAPPAGEPETDPDMVAAVAYARRRRLGPWRSEDTRADRRTRDLAALARRGFSSAIAHAVIDAADPAAAEDMAEGR